jgi:hypothetical protein
MFLMIVQILANCILQSSRVLDLIASDIPFPSYVETSKLINSIVSGKKTTASLEESIEKTDELLAVVPKPDKSFFSNDLLTEINNEAKTHFASCAQTIGTDDDIYITQLTAYVRAVNLQLDKLRPNHPLLDKAKAKLLWIHCPRDGQHPRVPLMTPWVIESLCASLAQVKVAIEEVSHCSKACIR